MRAASILAERIAASGAARVAFLGLAKNAGKTTALVESLRCLDLLSIPVGATSAGRDGEEFDAITGEEKPRFRLRPQQLVASAASTFAPGRSRLVRALPFETRFGPIEIRRVSGDETMEVIGPATVSQMAETVAALRECGAALVVIDGAFGRRAFASARAADAVVLSAGLSAGGGLPGAVRAAALAVELIGLPAPAPGCAAREFTAALTDASLGDRPPRRGETLVAEDFASMFLSPEMRRRLAAEGVALAVRRPARLIAVTSNPTAPGGRSVPPAALFEALADALPGLALFDLGADLARLP